MQGRPHSCGWCANLPDRASLKTPSSSSNHWPAWSKDYALALPRCPCCSAKSKPRSCWYPAPAEAIAESTHLVNALRDGGFRLGGVVVNLVHPLPPPVEAFFDLAPGPLADHVAYHADLFALATSERHEMAELMALAKDAAEAELPLLEADIHDIAGLTRLAEMLVPG